MAVADVTYRFKGDATDLVAAGQQAQAALDKTAQEATVAGQKIGKSFDDIGKKAGDVGSSAKKLRGILGTLSPELANLAGLVDDTADAIEIAAKGGASLVIALGAVGAAVAALVVAYEAVTVSIERETAAHEQEHRIAQSMIEVNRSLETVQLDLAHAYGQLGDAQLQQAKNALAAQGAVLDFAESHREEKKALQESVDSIGFWADAYKALPFTVDAAVDAVADLVFGFDASKAAIGRLNNAEEDYAAKQKHLRELLNDLAAAQDENTESTERARTSVKALTETYDGLNDARFVEGQQDDFFEALKEEERWKKRIAKADAYIAEQARKAAEEQAQAELDFQDLKAKGIAEAIDGAAKVGDAVKDAGRVGFAVWKATALAQIVFSTATGIQNAIAEFAAIPPIAAALSATIAASGVIQAAKIAGEQPTFHMGGVNRADETTATLQKNETVLTARGTASIVDAINRGQVGGGGSDLGLTVLDHRAFGRTVRDEVRQPSSLGRAITGAKSVKPGRFDRRRAT